MLDGDSAYSGGVIFTQTVQQTKNTFYLGLAPVVRRSGKDPTRACGSSSLYPPFCEKRERAERHRDRPASPRSSPDAKLWENCLRRPARAACGQRSGAKAKGGCAKILSKNSKIRRARNLCEWTISQKSPPAMPMAITETPSGGRRQILADPLAEKA